MYATIKKRWSGIVGLLLLLSSCGTAKYPAYSGIGRVKEYAFYSKDVPPAFDGFRIAFASDFHYKSKFKEKALVSAVRTLNGMHPDVLLLGGDYQEGCNYISGLFKELARVKTPFGTYGVMGNNDYERCHDEIVGEMERYGMKVLEHTCDTLAIGSDFLILAGIRNPFDLERNGISPTLNLKPDDFVVMLTHTPDYAQDVDISNTDLVLAGHTHGGQITLGKLYTPLTGSRYGRKFLTGRSETTKGIPVITTNGLGTSRINLRLFAPSEVVLIILHREEAEQQDSSR